jgi:hypothetical protein
VSLPPPLSLSRSDSLDWLRNGNPAIHEPPETDLLDIHSLSGLSQKSIINSANGVLVLLLYERGGYVHPLHPINNQTAASPEVLHSTERVLETFTHAIQIIRRNTTRQGGDDSSRDQLSYAVFYRLDVMEEKGYEGLDTFTRLQLTRDQLPAVVMLKGPSLLRLCLSVSSLSCPLSESLSIDMSPFERVPYVFPSRFLSEPVHLAEKIAAAVLNTDELLREPAVMERLNGEDKEQVDRLEIIDGSRLSSEELRHFLKLTPQK